MEHQLTCVTNAVAREVHPDQRAARVGQQRVAQLLHPVTAEEEESEGWWEGTGREETVKSTS